MTWHAATLARAIERGMPVELAIERALRAVERTLWAPRPEFPAPERSRAHPDTAGRHAGACAHGMRGPVLTARQREVLELVRDGLRPKDIAERLCLSVATVRTHVRDAAERLQASGAYEAARACPNPAEARRGVPAGDAQRPALSARQAVFRRQTHVLTRFLTNRAAG